MELVSFLSIDLSENFFYFGLEPEAPFIPISAVQAAKRYNYEEKLIAFDFVYLMFITKFYLY